MENMQIRTMKVADYEKVYSLWMSCKNMGFNDIDDSKEGITRFLERNPNTSFVAMENDELLGIILGGHDGRRGYIYHMSVAEISTKLTHKFTQDDSYIKKEIEQNVHRTLLLVLSIEHICGKKVVEA